MIAQVMRRLLVLSCAATAACSLQQGGPVISDKVWLMNEGYPTGSAKASQDTIPAACPQKEAEVVDFNGDSSSKKINDCVYAMLQVIDVKFVHFQDQLFGSTSGVNFAADIGLLGIGTAGSFVSGAATQALHAVSAGITGVRSSINQDWFYSNTITTILIQMQNDRAAVKTGIMARIAAAKPNAAAGAGSQPPARPYTNIYDAVNDLLAYSRAGSWTEALLSIQKSAVKSAGNPPNVGNKTPSP